MKKIILLILDGFGIREGENGNAIKMANMPVLTKIMEDFRFLMQIFNESDGNIFKKIKNTFEIE